MSMVLTSTTASDRAHYATLFARYLRARRRQLRLSTARAAELAGMALSEWCAMEAGWVPEDYGTLRAISETLQVRTSDLLLMAFVSSCAQPESRS